MAQQLRDLVSRIRNDQALNVSELDNEGDGARLVYPPAPGGITEDILVGAVNYPSFVSNNLQGLYNALELLDVPPDITHEILERFMNLQREVVRPMNQLYLRRQVRPPMGYTAGSGRSGNIGYPPEGYGPGEPGFEDMDIDHYEDEGTQWIPDQPGNDRGRG